MISIGTIGLIKAVATFNPSKNNRLGTYAARCIENEILMMLRSKKKYRKRFLSMNQSAQTVKETKYSFFDIIEADDDDAQTKVALKEDIKMLYTKVESELHLASGLF